MALEKELAAYARLLPELLAEQGRFVLIRGDEKLDVFDTYQDALAAGYKTCGLEPFLIRQIQAVQQVGFLSRDVTAACHT